MWFSWFPLVCQSKHLGINHNCILQYPLLLSCIWTTPVMCRHFLRVINMDNIKFYTHTHTHTHTEPVHQVPGISLRQWRCWPEYGELPRMLSDDLLSPGLKQKMAVEAFVQHEHNVLTWRENGNGIAKYSRTVILRTCPILCLPKARQPFLSSLFTFFWRACNWPCVLRKMTRKYCERLFSIMIRILTF